MNFITIFQYSFIQRAIITGIFVALLCSTLGLFLVLRRLSLIGDGLAHISFGGVALGLFLGVFPIYIAIPTVIIGALIILVLMDKIKIYGDAAIGIIASVGIAAGVILASISHGFNLDLLSYLFGNILAISIGEMYLSIALSIVVLLVISLFIMIFFQLRLMKNMPKLLGCV